jgi:hypothetical protein
MKLVPLNDIFDIIYGHQLNANSLDEDPNGINFVTRSRKRLGISGKVARLKSIEPHMAGAITVTLGGSYLLSSFVQPEEFYTAQNVKVLRPKVEMDFRTKIYYCACITHNRFRYSSHGREANRSLNMLSVPSLADVPDWVANANPALPNLNPADFLAGSSAAHSADGYVSLTSLFELINGVNLPAHVRDEERITPDFVPFIRPSKTQDSCFVEYVDKTKIPSTKVFPAGTLYISTNGQGSHTYSYVSPFEFVPNSDVTVAIPRRPLSLAEKLFYAAAISSNRHLFSYGRKPKGGRLAELLIPSKAPKFVQEKDVFKRILEEAL